ncbi:DUF2189 domain-containing protein [Inquilinus limosus]|uniref:DUF2189 domain-containing protein n=1 Tax=Inquilinus limosus TaxID=171674 RepID=A0A211ZLR1_9PROT|nr:DUF2189 domain-containing protein [Inquilinus limosus]OWJ66211.1 hypothetical protein BWR60_15780 [Inquilinus limosus]
MTIRNPLEWGADQLRFGGHALRTGGQSVFHAEENPNTLAPAVHRIGLHDLREALAKGFEDFGHYRTDVLYLCLIYPVVGLVLARAMVGQDMIPLLFPLASGFALIGPFAAIGLYEMSRRREMGQPSSWGAAFGVLRTPRFGVILTVGAILAAIFVLWMFLANVIYNNTLGPDAPASLGSFLSQVFGTAAGWTLIVVGCGVGLVFAVAAMAIGVVSFPLLLDRDVGADTAIWTSVRAVAANPVPMAAWGLIVVAGLVLGSIPLFVGLIVVMPVLGHATWHLYRRMVN